MPQIRTCSSPRLQGTRCRSERESESAEDVGDVQQRRRRLHRGRGAAAAGIGMLAVIDAGFGRSVGIDACGAMSTSETSLLDWAPPPRFTTEFAFFTLATC